MDMDFWTFLYEAGMFRDNKQLNQYTKDEKELAKTRYLNAISASVKGTAMLLLKRKVKDIFVNAYNLSLIHI